VFNMVNRNNSSKYYNSYYYGTPEQNDWYSFTYSATRRRRA
jgi:hypothetical protein